MTPRRVDNIHIGDYKAGIIITYENGDIESLPMTRHCHTERQNQAESFGEAMRHKERSARQNIGMLRQLINEEYVGRDGKRMITNDVIERILFGEN